MHSLRLHNCTTAAPPLCLAAGDCFTAAYAVALLEGAAPPEAMRFAGTAAALCIQRHGALPSMPSRAEVEAALLLAGDGGGEAPAPAAASAISGQE